MNDWTNSVINIIATYRVNPDRCIVCKTKIMTNKTLKKIDIQTYII